MSKIEIADIAFGFGLSKINENFQAIQETLNDKVLWRENPVGEPNQMHNELDMNGNRIYNLPTPIADHEPMRKIDGQNVLDAIPEILEARDEAVAAAGAAQDAADLAWGAVGASDLGNLKVFATYAAAVSAAEFLPTGQYVQAPDSNGKLSRFIVQTGALVFLDFVADTLTLQNYTNLRTHTGASRTINIADEGVRGTFVYDALDTTSSDNNGTILVDSTNRRWKRIYSGVIHVGWFGAKGDGTDETAKLQAALDAAGYNWVTGGGSQYTVKSLLVNSNQRIQTLRLKTLAGSEDFVSPITIDGRTTAKTNMQLYDVHIDGNRQNQALIVSATEDGGRSGFRILGKVSKLYIKNSSANYCGTDGLEFFSYVVPWPAFTDIVVENCEFNWSRRHGGAIDSTNNVKIINTVFNNNGLDLNTTDPETHGNRGSRQVGSLYGNGFDAESYGAGTHCVDLTFDKCTMLGNARSGLLVLPNGLDYGTANWKPYAQIVVRDGRYDAGTQTYSGKSPITFTALNMTSAQRGFTDITIDGANCAVGGPTLKYVKSARIKCQAVELDAAGFHAGVIDSDDVIMDLGLVDRPAVVYTANASPTIAQPFTGKAMPTLTAFQGCTVSNVVTTAMGGNVFDGQSYRVVGKITQTATGAPGWMAIGANGRGLVDAKIDALNPNTGLPCITGFNPAGYLGINSGTVATHDFVATIILR